MEQNKTEYTKNLKWILLYSILLFSILGGGVYYFSNLICKHKIREIVDSSTKEVTYIDSVITANTIKNNLLIDSIEILSKDLNVLNKELQQQNIKYHELVKKFNRVRSPEEVQGGLQEFINEYRSKNN